MRKPIQYLYNLIKEIEDACNFRYAEEPWAVEAKIQEGSKTYINMLRNEVLGHLYDETKKNRVVLTEEQKEQVKTALEEAMKKAEARFGSFD